MSKKNLLKENTVRRWMQLAGNTKYSDNFINEQWLPNASGLEEGDLLDEDDITRYEDIYNRI